MHARFTRYVHRRSPESGRECRRGDIHPAVPSPPLAPSPRHARSMIHAVHAVQGARQENDQVKVHSFKSGPQASDPTAERTKGWTVNEIPSTPSTCASSPPSSGHRVAGTPPCPRSPPRSIDPWYAGMRDDDDAAWLMVRLRRQTSSPDALGIAAARRRRRRARTLLARGAARRRQRQ